MGKGAVSLPGTVAPLLLPDEELLVYCATACAAEHRRAPREVEERISTYFGLEVKEDKGKRGRKLYINFFHPLARTHADEVRSVSDKVSLVYSRGGGWFILGAGLTNFLIRRSGWIEQKWPPRARSAVMRRPVWR